MTKRISSAVTFVMALAVWLVAPATQVPNFAAARDVAALALRDFGRWAQLHVALRGALWSQAFQGAISATRLATGIPGEMSHDGPTRVQPGVTKGTAANIVVGRAFTRDPADGLFLPGGDGGVFAGILCNPKAYASLGTLAGGAMAPTMTLPAGTVGEFMTMGYIWVLLSNAAAVGDGVWYDDVTGALGAGVASTGQTQIADAEVVRFSNAAAGLACVSLSGA